MIARHETYMDRTDIWSKLAAPLPDGVVSWRQDGRVVTRDGRHFARFVAYVDANTVRERLDGVVPGEWDLTLDLLPALPALDDEGALCSFKARLQILGVIREDVGTGRDYKAAATDAFKRAAVRFGVAHELYAYEQNWVQMDGDGRYARPLEDPLTAYVRRYGSPSANPATAPAPAATVAGDAPAAVPTSAAPPRRRGRVSTSEPVLDAGVAAELHAHDADMPSCPKCDGRMWDNRLSKRNPRAPDYKCRDRSCDGVIWPPRAAGAAGANGAADAPLSAAEAEAAPRNGSGPLVEAEADVAVATSDDDLPF